MNRLSLVVSVLALLVALASPVAAKVANVTNPMTADLDGGANRIQNVSVYKGIDTDLGAVHARQGFYTGSVSTPFVDLTVADGFVEITAGTTDPVGRGTPGLYLQRTSDGVAVWAKTGATAADWTCIAGCP